MASPYFGDDLKKLYPVCDYGQSDTAVFDNCLELLVASGYSLAQAVMMMIPEPGNKMIRCQSLEGRFMNIMPL